MSKHLDFMLAIRILPKKANIVKKNKIFSLRNAEDRSVERAKEAERSEYAENWEASPNLRRIIKWSLMAMTLIFLVIILYKKKNEPYIDHAALADEDKKRRFLGKKYKDFSKLRDEADVAFDAKDYFEAAFKYKQSLGFYPEDLEVTEKLLLATQKSCEQKNEMHCDNIEGVKNRIVEIKKLREQ